jgi:hypothetical protein
VLGDRPTSNNKHLWATNNKLTGDQEEVLTLLEYDIIVVDYYPSVTIGREHFYKAKYDEATGVFTSTMGSSHLKANFLVQSQTRASDTNKEEMLQSRYGIVTEILQLHVPKKTVLLNVRWYKHDNPKEHPVTKNVHVFLDAPFENTLECMIAPDSIENMVVLFDLACRPLDDPPMLRPKAAILDRRFSGSICMPVP